MTTDYRTDRMDSAEGLGRARKRFEKALEPGFDFLDRTLGPIVEPHLIPIAARIEAGLMGFWLMWHLHGGFEGLQTFGMSRTTIYRKIKLFRTVTGKHPDEFEIPGVRIDVKKYLEAAQPDT